jgi:signal transduction histidine kinase
VARLHTTSTFRITLLHLALFIASVGLVLWVAYRSTAGFMEEEVAETIATDVAGLKEHYRLNGLQALVDVVRARSAVPHTKALYLLATPSDLALAGNLVGWPAEQPGEDGLIHFRIAEYGASTSDKPATAQAAAYVLGGGFRLLVGRDTSDIDRLRTRMVASLSWILAVTAALGLVGGAFISRSALRRIESVNRTTRRIMAGDLSGRVALTGSNDEFDRLAGNLNAMLDQIERLMAGNRQVTEAIAHDLRTPLTRLRSRIELVLLRDTDDAEVYRTVLQETLGEADRLLATFKALLSIAEAEAGTRRGDFKPVDLAELARLVADLYEPVAEETGHAFKAEVHGRPMVLGNGQLLSQAAANLIDNAIKYTPPGGTITLTVDGKAPGQGARIAVADTGPGIPAEDREKVLQRFVRLDGARATPGNGLGLSLVEAVARLHDGGLELSDNDPQGLRIAIVLPPRAVVSRLEASAALS